MLEHIHPSQLEQKYGGDAENLEEYWPPKVISSEYGQDPDFIYEDNLEDASFDHIATPGDLIKSMKSKHRSETCLKTLSFLTKKNTSKKRHHKHKKSRSSKYLEQSYAKSEESKEEKINKHVDIPCVKYQAAPLKTEFVHPRREELKAVNIAKKDKGFAIKLPSVIFNCYLLKIFFYIFIFNSKLKFLNEFNYFIVAYFSLLIRMNLNHILNPCFN